MPAVSKAQAKAAQIALKARKDDTVEKLPKDSASRDMADSMTMKELEKLASTDLKDLPDKVGQKESVSWAGMSLAEALEEKKIKYRVEQAADDKAFELFFKDVMKSYEEGREAATKNEYSTEEFEILFDELSSDAENRQGWLSRQLSNFSNSTAPNGQNKFFRELFGMFRDRAYLAGYEDKIRDMNIGMNEEMIGVSDTDDPEEQIVTQKSKKDRIEDKEIKNGKGTEDTWDNTVHGASPALAHHSAGSMSSNTMGARVAESSNEVDDGGVIFESLRWKKLAGIDETPITEKKEKWIKGAVNPKEKGEFTAKAKAAGMSVQKYADHVLKKAREGSWTGDEETVDQAKFAKSAESIADKKSKK